MADRNCIVKFDYDRSQCGMVRRRAFFNFWNVASTVQFIKEILSIN